LGFIIVVAPLQIKVGHLARRKVLVGGDNL
jgi:hypothetical protein